MVEYNIAVIRGDGVGPEVVDIAVKILEKVADKFNHKFNFKYALAGGCAIDAVGKCLPKETLDLCRNCDSIMLGAVGGPKWDNVDNENRPEKALLGLRKTFNLYSNLRPCKIYDSLKSASPLKAEIVEQNIDIMIVRELTGGIYFGDRGNRVGKKGIEAYDTECYSESEIARIAKSAFEIAMKRRKKVTSVDKANVLESSKLWRRVVIEISKDFPEVELEHMYIDNASMQLVRNPSQFDVIVTSNMFGDILSDEAGMITGSIGLLPSASLNGSSFGMYEPVHGSAPDIAGKFIANPIAAILSAAMMLKYSFNMSKESESIEEAVNRVLLDGYGTIDICNDKAKILKNYELCGKILEYI